MASAFQSVVVATIRKLSIKMVSACQNKIENRHDRLATMNVREGISFKTYKYLFCYSYIVPSASVREVETRIINYVTNDEPGYRLVTDSRLASFDNAEVTVSFCKNEEAPVKAFRITLDTTPSGVSVKCFLLVDSNYFDARITSVGFSDIDSRSFFSSIYAYLTGNGSDLPNLVFKVSNNSNSLLPVYYADELRPRKPVAGYSPSVVIEEKDNTAMTIISTIIIFLAVIIGIFLLTQAFMDAARLNAYSDDYEYLTYLTMLPNFALVSLLINIACAAGAGMNAAHKGYSYAGFFLLGLSLGIVGLAISIIFQKKNTKISEFSV